MRPGLCVNKVWCCLHDANDPTSKTEIINRKLKNKVEPCVWQKMQRCENGRFKLNKVWENVRNLSGRLSSAQTTFPDTFGVFHLRTRLLVTWPLSNRETKQTHETEHLRDALKQKLEAGREASKCSHSDSCRLFSGQSATQGWNVKLRTYEGIKLSISGSWPASFDTPGHQTVNTLSAINTVLKY